jgi:catechol 2,3-dioxygenase-like lactoylglutathione lyase family enzyme
VVEINGIAHIALTVNRLDVCAEFYDALLCERFRFTKVNASDVMHYYIGGRTAVAIAQAAPEHLGQRFEDRRVGLHHVCFRGKSREDIDRLYEEFLVPRGVKLYYPPREGPWAPGYYSVSFFDPDGIRLEVNHVPGQGVLAPGATFDPAGDY